MGKFRTEPILHTAKNQPTSSLSLSFQGLPLFLGKEKLAKYTYFAPGRCFIHLPLIFANQRVQLYLCRILNFASVCFAKVCEYTVLPNAMKNALLIVRVILWRWSIKPLRYYATFKMRKFELYFYKTKTCLQKPTTCIGLQAEQIFSVNI